MSIVLLAGIALVLAVCLGLVVHELAHATVLRLGRVECSVTYLPGRTDGVFSAAFGRPWAVVEPRLTGRESAWVLRSAALAPLALCAPVLAAAAFGTVSADHPIVTAFAVGWLACALPSPQDFSVAFYAHRLLEERTAPRTGADAPGAD